MTDSLTVLAGRQPVQEGEREEEGEEGEEEEGEEAGRPVYLY